MQSACKRTASVLPRTGGRSQPLLAEAGTPVGPGAEALRTWAMHPAPAYAAGRRERTARATPGDSRHGATMSARAQTPHGGGCVPTIVGQCQLGQVWNGIACDQPVDECTTFRSRAETIRTEAFGVG